MISTSYVHYLNMECFVFVCLSKNVREYRRGNQKRTIQRNWQDRVYKPKGKKQTKTQYMLDTTLHKQTQRGINKTCPSYKQLEVKYELNVARTQDKIPLMISTASIHYLNMECFLCLSNYGNISL